jgi:hypothetical protein
MLAVVYEAMADAGPGRKGRKVPGPHRVKKTVYPSFNLTLENVYKLFLFLLGMRPGTSFSRRQPHQVHANLEQSRSFADAPLIAGVFVAVRILVARLRT